MSQAAEAPKPEDSGGQFQCAVCRLSERYDYKGRSPPFSRWATFTEDSYVQRDPFSPWRDAQFLLLGSDCAACSHPVCQAQGCSLFYARRFCRPCAEGNAEKFPHEVQAKIRRMGQCKE